jgi:hypothetical protein
VEAAEAVVTPDAAQNPSEVHHSLSLQSIDAPKQVMKITKCPHVNRKHYAKNMCSSCYRKYGRN